MKTLHPAYRVTDPAASLDFYLALGYVQVGRVDVGDGDSLTMLKFPSEEMVTLELVYRPTDEPVDIGTGFSHLAVQVENLSATMESLTRAGLRPSPVERPGGPDGPKSLGSQTPMATGSSWCNGHPDTLTESRRLIFVRL